jgi:hypothetical protein
MAQFVLKDGSKIEVPTDQIDSFIIENQDKIQNQKTTRSRRPVQQDPLTSKV